VIPSFGENAISPERAFGPANMEPETCVRGPGDESVGKYLNPVSPLNGVAPTPVAVTT
jgi:hypothetical protein